MNVHALAYDIPDEATLYSAACLARTRHLHLVIDRDGQARLTPLVLPGMQKIAVLDKQFAAQNDAANREDSHGVIR